MKKKYKYLIGSVLAGLLAVLIINSMLVSYNDTFEYNPFCKATPQEQVKRASDIVEIEIVKSEHVESYYCLHEARVYKWWSDPFGKNIDGFKITQESEVSRNCLPLGNKYMALLLQDSPKSVYRNCRQISLIEMSETKEILELLKKQ